YVCVTAQHREMLDQVLEIFNLVPDYDLDIMKHAQGLSQITADVLTKLTPVLAELKPDRVLVHGDTTTAMAASLAAFYQKIPVGNVEAGLRSGDMFNPWPEEMNRMMVGRLADLHFSPTSLSRDNLLEENTNAEQIHITGNTVIDTIFTVTEKFRQDSDLKRRIGASCRYLDPSRKLILITAHRRENFGAGLNSICKAIAKLAENKTLQIIYPVHLNPNVKGPVSEVLGGFDNVKLIAPLDYLQFVYLMERAYIILTDSGGIQEEAPSLGKPVLVMRETTERPEAVKAGTVKLVGTEADKIIKEVSMLLEDRDEYEKMSRAYNPYGDGQASERIVEILSGNNNVEEFMV
ncbi:UDP-N-acetylglucosamine 2-epimerase (non-hydrolyzing), partial [bacterium]|nr:UDP-N-acetylglucosamine 2-epimerase (non-hydrolyzing) [bacterium]